MFVYVLKGFTGTYTRWMCRRTSDAFSPKLSNVVATPSRPVVLGKTVPRRLSAPGRSATGCWCHVLLLLLIVTTMSPPPPSWRTGSDGGRAGDLMHSDDTFSWMEPAGNCRRTGTLFVTGLSNTATTLTRPVMLRETNRLAVQLSDNGYRIYFHVAGFRGAIEKEILYIKEAEVVWPTETTAFDFSVLKRFKNEHVEYGYTINGAADDPYVDPDEAQLKRSAFPNGERFDILWVSKTEFIALHRIAVDPGLHVEHLYTIEVHASKKLLRLQAFRTGIKKTVPAAAPLGFLCQVLTPIFHVVSRIVIKCWTNPPVDEVLSLIPTASAHITRNIEIAIEAPSTDLLRALVSHPFHRRVVLQLEVGQSTMHDEHPVSHEDGRATAGQINNLLREFRYPVHLQVPYVLLDYEAADEVFTVNPVCESITIAANGGKQLSPRLLEGIVRNKSMTRLTIDYRDLSFRDYYPEIPEWNKALFNSVVFENESSLQVLILASRFDYFDFDGVATLLEMEQAAFVRLTQVLESQSNTKHGLSRFILTFPHSRLKPAIKSNDLWDARFSPSLLVNCLRRQPGGIPSRNFAGHAIERINQGVLYQHATNLVPCNLSASSATAIFDILRCVLKNSRSRSE
jgi:hypothetical protein